MCGGVCVHKFPESRANVVEFFLLHAQCSGERERDSEAEEQRQRRQQSKSGKKSLLWLMMPSLRSCV